MKKLCSTVVEFVSEPVQYRNLYIPEEINGPGIIILQVQYILQSKFYEQVHQNFLSPE